MTISAVTDTDPQGGVTVEVAQINPEGFASKQMDRDSVAAEGVNCEKVKPLSRFAFERKPRVAKLDGDLPTALAAIPQVGEPCTVLSDFDDGRVELVERDRIARVDVSGQRSYAKPDDGDVHSPGVWRLALEVIDRAADAAGTSKIGRRLAAARRMDELRAVRNRAMAQNIIARLRIVLVPIAYG